MSKLCLGLCSFCILLLFLDTSYATQLAPAYWNPRTATPLPGTTFYALTPQLQSTFLSPDATRILNQTIIGASSHLEDIDLLDKQLVAQKLVEGECRETTQCNGRGTFRFSPEAAKAFVDGFQIVRHMPNDASGLSATLLRNNFNHQYILAIRGAERPPAHQTEINKDKAAVNEAMSMGIALAQTDRAIRMVDSFRKEIPEFAEGKVILAGMGLAGHICLNLNASFPHQFGLLYVSRPIPYFPPGE